MDILHVFFICFKIFWGSKNRVDPKLHIYKKFKRKTHLFLADESQHLEGKFLNILFGCRKSATSFVSRLKKYLMLQIEGKFIIY
jgi:hypothetical protein